MTSSGRVYSCDSNLYRAEFRDFESEQLTVKIYPNPTRSVVNMSIPVANSTIEIISSNGKLLKTHQVINAGILSVDMTEFMDGIYFARFINGDRIVNKRFIKM